ncbi:MAG TPA: sodium:proton antiporter NhaD [Stellaceae bacterium]|nr:sodium:proton antiporter NhaD [Stellaceae bacterium]
MHPQYRNAKHANLPERCDRRPSFSYIGRSKVRLFFFHRPTARADISLCRSLRSRVAGLADVLVAIALIFVLAYTAIALEHPIGISKSATALLGAGLLWTIYSFATADHVRIASELNDTIGSTAQIIFFLMGAMTIVEVIDAHGGFEIITSRIRTDRLTSLLWLVSWATFVLSAILDNLTTTIVMVSLVGKLLANARDRLLFASMVVIAANAGGAWSPIGDVTTTMLWIGGHISGQGIIADVFLASVVNLLVPLTVVSFQLRGRRFTPDATATAALAPKSFERNVILVLGLALLVAVPAFKQGTHLPAFLGSLLALGILWLTGELMNRGKRTEARIPLTVARALSQIDHGSLLFFVGILLAVATLQYSGILAALAGWLDRTVGQQGLVVLFLGLLSALIDNVPLVAASMAMYASGQYPVDSFLWEFIAYCAGTGGSILIIGSAAGVAAMGVERIQFLWYLRKVSGLATLGYLAGAVAYVMQYALTR